MVDMVKKYIIPAVNSIETGPLQSLQECVQAITEKVAEIKRVDSHNLVKSAELSQQLRLDLMMKMRDACDDAESVVPANLWPLATYKELMFD
jgi:glutamine synthetase